MADITIPDECAFEVGADKIRLTTQTNGDAILIRGIHLGSEAAATLAHLINNTENHLEIKIKEA